MPFQHFLQRLTSACLAACAASGALAQAEKGVAGVEAETLAEGLRFPWSMAFTPEGDILIVEKQGGVRVFRGGALLPDPLTGGPTGVLVNADSGLHDIALDPDFERSRTVFIAYEEGEEEANRLAVWRARFDGRRMTGGRVIYRTIPDKSGAGHPGGRIAFLPDRTFLLSVGDGYDYRDSAQDLRSPLGKVLRLDRNGQPPSDNPFYGRPDARPELWTLGHRNMQGLIVDPDNGAVWSHEHGPRGGDEVNGLAGGANYGWPLTTNGIDYSGEIISERAHAPGIVSPLMVWSPSIAPSGLAVYRGDKFPAWNGHLLVGALAARSLIRTQQTDDGKLVESERLLEDLGARIRDVRVGPDGYIYVLTDEANGRLIRLRPTAK